jgi:hypothetical protein
LVVVPCGLGATLDGWLRNWARRNYGPDVPAQATDYRGQHPTQLEDRAEQQARLLRYVLKSSDNATVRSAGGEPATLHNVLEVEKRKRAYCARIHRVAGTSQNISLREQLWAGFWRVSSPEIALTDHYLDDWRRARNLDEMLAMLRKIDI